ncbi:hypothetical protein [Enterobacter roggenkampii]|uniref:hypothetical protein n=1 Tax=Enterobacter roggenkampii TaxID=1812935 RepID=UPI002A80197F|nr:hypothetical protein [Enterobacter roggenkampii]
MKNTALRRTTLARLVVQLVSPLSLAFTPAIASAVQHPRDAIRQQVSEANSVMAVSSVTTDTDTPVTVTLTVFIQP